MNDVGNIIKAPPQQQPSHCAPNRYARFLSAGTCLNPDELVFFAHEFNRTISPKSKQIPRGNITRHRATSGALVADLATRIGTDDASAWLQLPWVSKDAAALLRPALRPEMPRSWLANSRAWLTTDDIENVMQQYEEAYPTFKFLGVFPIDFDTRVGGARSIFGGSSRCIADEMCNLSVKKLKDEDQKNQFGAVLNLDKHNERGSHWVAVYGNSDVTSENFGVHYYDSVGRGPPKEVVRFQHRIAAQIATLSGRRLNDVPISTGNERRQYKNTECGIFAMYYLVCCMAGNMRVSDIVHAMGQDDLIHRLRFIFFRPPARSS